MFVDGVVGDYFCGGGFGAFGFGKGEGAVFFFEVGAGDGEVGLKGNRDEGGEVSDVFSDVVFGTEEHKAEIFPVGVGSCGGRVVVFSGSFEVWFDEFGVVDEEAVDVAFELVVELDASFGGLFEDDVVGFGDGVSGLEVGEGFGSLDVGHASVYEYGGVFGEGGGEWCLVFAGVVPSEVGNGVEFGLCTFVLGND